MMMARLGLPHFLIFANPSAFIHNKFLANQLASVPEFIGVGAAKGQANLTAQDKLFTALKEQLSPNVLNYPQGFVANAGEILPIHAQFVEKLLFPLIVNGYRVNIIPVTYESDSELLAPSRDLGHAAKYIVKIHAPLRSESVEKLVRMQLGISDINKECKLARNPFLILDHLLISIWYESTTINKELTLDDLFQRAQERLAISFKNISNPQEDMGLLSPLFQ